MSLSVASVTVVYNDARVLPRQIEALLRQTRPVQEIVVVDNASTDGTSALLADRYPQVKVLRMSENLGVGGGVAAGLAYAALERRHDWIWTFDADSAPNDDTLEALLEATESLGNTDGEVGMAAPLPIHQETGTCYPPLLWRDGYVKPSAELLRQPIWFADLVIGSGAWCGARWWRRLDCHAPISSCISSTMNTASECAPMVTKSPSSRVLISPTKLEMPGGSDCPATPTSGRTTRPGASITSAATSHTRLGGFTRAGPPKGLPCATWLASRWRVALRLQ